MKRYFLYLFVYSLGGWVLERIINLIAFGEWVDNSVLFGPYQPLYGAGVVMAVLLYEFWIQKLQVSKLPKDFILLFFAIVTTAISEAVTGFGFEYLTGIHLWDYTATFPLSIMYLSFIATPLFGFASFLVIKYLHPHIDFYIQKIPPYITFVILSIFTLDIILTIVLY